MGWTIILFLAGLGFLLAGLSSYFKINLLFVTDLTTLAFVPQGIVMTFYGLLGLGFSSFLAALIIWNVGSGYNKYDKLAETIKIVRRGFPGKDRTVEIECKWVDVKAIEMNVSDGLNPKRELFLCLKDGRKIPLTEVGSPQPLLKIEQKAIELASFLQVKIEGI